MNLEPLIRLRERDFADAAQFDYAPADTADAMDNYRRVLDLVGQIAGETISPALAGHRYGGVAPRAG